MSTLKRIAVAMERLVELKEAAERRNVADNQAWQEWADGLAAYMAEAKAQRERDRLDAERRFQIVEQRIAEREARDRAERIGLMGSDVKIN